MRLLLLGLFCVVAFAACDASDQISEVLEPSVEPLPFSRITVTSAPLVADEDGTAMDLYAELQDAGGGSVYQGVVIENADASAFPYTIATDGVILGEQIGYYVAVLDDGSDGLRSIVKAGPFTGTDLRAAQGSFEVRGENRNGVLEATITL